MTPQADPLTDAEQLREIVESSHGIVFFGGAGVSTESGIPDFRSAGGLYDEVQRSGGGTPIPGPDGGREAVQTPESHNPSARPTPATLEILARSRPEEILSHTFFVRHTEAFFHYYRTRILHPDAQPNPAHRALAALEVAGRLSAVITQNIDGLHQAAGSRRVLELHGSVHRNVCMSCGRRFALDAVLRSTGVPRCDACGGVIKPDVVLYEEALDQRVLAEAADELDRADTLIVGGTSLVVYPAAGLVRAFGGDRVVVINRDATGLDHRATLTIRAPIGETLAPFADAH